MEKVNSEKGKSYFDFFILFIIVLSIGVMGGVGFDLRIGKTLVSLHSIQNISFLAVVIWIIKKVYFREKWNNKSLDLPVLIYIFVYFVSIIYSSYPEVSLLFLWDTIIAILFCNLLIDNIKDKSKLEAVLFILLISVICTISFGIFQHLRTQMGSGDDSYYSFVGRAEFGAVAVLTIPILTGFLLNYKKNLLAAFIFIIGLIILFTGIIVSYSRGSWLGLIIVFLFFVFLHNRILKNPRVFLLKILIIIFLFLVLPASVKNRINSIKDFSSTSGDRITTWKSSVDMFKDSPFLGVGPGTYGLIVPRFRKLEAIETWTRGWHAHNIFLHIAVENGMIGLISFLIIIAVSFKKYFELKRKIEDRKLKNILNGAIVSLTGYLACSQMTIFFANYNKNEKISMFLWFDIALIFIIENIAKKQEGNSIT